VGWLCQPSSTEGDLHLDGLETGIRSRNEPIDGRTRPAQAWRYRGEGLSPKVFACGCGYPAVRLAPAVGFPAGNYETKPTSTLSQEWEMNVLLDDLDWFRSDRMGRVSSG
jgi:hypothetical protein